MAESPLISIVTPCFNSAATLEQTIQSVLTQGDVSYEHIVIDGGSTDSTVAIVRQHPHLRWISEKDEGHYHAMNKGIALARGEWIVILNADDCFRPGALRRVAEACHQHPEWDALFGDVVFVDAQGRQIYLRQEALYDYGVLLYGLDYICHQTLFVRKPTYERVGGYRHREFLNACDYEFKLRLGQRRCVVGHVPVLLVDYRYHDLGQSADRRVIRNMLAETARIRLEYGNPGGWRGRFLQGAFKAKRQWQKLRLRHRCDLIPGTWRLRAHLRERTHFSSNANLEKL